MWPSTSRLVSLLLLPHYHWEEDDYDLIDLDLVLFRLSFYGLQLFFVVIVTIVLSHNNRSGGNDDNDATKASSSSSSGIFFLPIPTIFFDWHGWSHRLAGGLNLLWLIYGCYHLSSRVTNMNDDEGRTTTTTSSSSLAYYYLFYDVMFGILGITTTLTAAKDFPHRLVSRKINADGQSGTLSQKAIVSQSEMIEHSYYQFLNLWQALYLHYCCSLTSSSYVASTFSIKRYVALFVVTSPWYIRRKCFPVHSFSDNWTKLKQQQKQEQNPKASTDNNDGNNGGATIISSKSQNRTTSTSTSTTTTTATQLETLLYRIKKGQYIFYKHFILHGINMSVCLQRQVPQQSSTLSSSSNNDSFHITSISWRFFWLCLNTSYVMEFFLQSMVKRHVMSQTTMLWLNRLLMIISSIAAYYAIFSIAQAQYWFLCMLSVLLNFIQRHHDVRNTMLLVSIAAIVSQQQ